MRQAQKMRTETYTDAKTCHDETMFAILLFQVLIVVTGLALESMVPVRNEIDRGKLYFVCVLGGSVCSRRTHSFSSCDGRVLGWCINGIQQRAVKWAFAVKSPLPQRCSGSGSFVRTDYHTYWPTYSLRRIALVSLLTSAWSLLVFQQRFSSSGCVYHTIYVW